MGHLSPLRVLAGPVLFASASVIPLAVSEAAWAKTPTDTCKAVVGDTAAFTGTLSGCPHADTGGSGTLSSFRPTGGAIAWRNGTTTVFATTSTGETEPKEAHPCPAGAGEYELSGGVTASTNRSIPAGGSFTIEVCVNLSTETIVNEPHTKVVFGS